MNVLDVAQNSVAAGAKLVQITLEADEARTRLLERVFRFLKRSFRRWRKRRRAERERKKRLREEAL